MRINNKLLIFIFYISTILFAQYPTLEELFEIEAKTKYFIVIDVSSSMAPYFNRVINALQTIPRALPPADTVSIYEFAEYPQKISSKQVRDIKQEDFPTSAPGNYTDIWAILESILSEMRQSQQDVFIIFFLTDGVDNPPPSALRDRERWQQIIENAQQILSNKIIVVYGIGLARNTDIHLLNSVFGNQNVEIIVMNPYSLKYSINRIIREAKKRRLKVMVKKEIEMGKIEINLEGKRETKEKIILKYSLASNYSYLPIKISIENLNYPDLETEIDQWVDIIQPKKNKKFSISFKKPFLNHWSIGRKSFIFKIKGKLNVNASFLHQQEIRELNLNPTVNISGMDIDIAHRIKYGIPIISLIVFIFSLILLIIFSKKWLSLSPPYVYGKILYPEGNIVKNLELQKQKITIGGSEKDDIRIMDVSSSFFEIKAKREKGLEILVISPLEGKRMKLDGKILIGEQELLNSVHRVEIENKEIILSNVAPKKSSTRSYFKFMLFIFVLLLLNLIIWKFAIL